MNEITERFNTEEALANFVLLAQRHKISSLPHGDTVNDFLEELEPEKDVCLYIWGVTYMPVFF